MQSALYVEQVAEGLNDTAENFLAAIERDESEIAPSSIYAAAAILEGVPFINGSPQNTFVPGLIELAVQKGAAHLRVYLLPAPLSSHAPFAVAVFICHLCVCWGKRQEAPGQWVVGCELSNDGMCTCASASSDCKMHAVPHVSLRLTHHQCRLVST